jgi:hypothetical protein
MVDDLENEVKSPESKLEDKYHRLNYDIKGWVSRHYKLDQMISEYNKNKSRWENESVRMVSIRTIMINLIKFCRYDFLEYLRINNPIYMDKSYYSENFYPFHELVWINFQISDYNKKSYKVIEKNVSSIKRTFECLIKFGFEEYIYKYREYSKRNDLSLSENYLMSLMHEANKIDKTSKNELLNYFLKEWENKHMIKYIIKNIINLEYQEDLINLYSNDLIYFIKKYNKDGIKEVVLNICEISNTDNINLKVSNLINILIEKLVNSNIENDKNIYSEYLQINNYTNFRKDFVNKIVKNYDLWIFDKVYSDYLSVCEDFRKIYEDNLYINNQIIKYYRNIMRILGCFYQLGISKENIITNVKSQITSKIEDINISLMYFIACSNININKMINYEESFIKSYLSEFYTKGSIRSKIYIKKTLEDLISGPVTNEQIEHIITH